MFLTDNNISGFSRFGFEIQQNSAGTFQDVHIDRNVVDISSTGNSAGNEVFSFVVGDSSLCNSVWGNMVTGVTGYNQLFLELGSYNTSVENNTVTDIDWAISFSTTTGSEVENNTFLSLGKAAFSDDGGFNNTQWIGLNTIDGASQSGWSGDPNTAAKPAVCSPSAAFKL
jgi:parallel beta-helix repeat protein